MATGWRGVAAGALALVALETLVQPDAAGRISGLFALPGSWAQKFLDPSVPAFHTSNKASSATPSSSTGGATINQIPNTTGGGSGSSSSGGTGPIYST